MKRRDFIKAMGALGVTTLAPSLFTDRDFISSAKASPAITSATVDLTGKRTPQVINIFLYGGASELAGNLTNILDINAASQSKYTEINNRFLNSYASDLPTATAQQLAQGNIGQITPNHLWAHAGGIVMEDMLYEGDLAIYRTCNRRKNNTRAHRPSIFSGQKGTLDIDSAPGLGTTLASVMAANRTTFQAHFGKSLEDMLMPMVSFEGESTTFAPDPNATTPIPLVLKPVGLSANFDNPYQRRGGAENTPVTAANLNNLADQKMRANPGITDPTDPQFELVSDNYGKRYKKVSESFIAARKLAGVVDGFNTLVNAPLSLPLLPERDPDGSNPDFDIILYEAYQLALSGEGWLHAQHNPAVPPDDPAYTDPAALSPAGNGLDTTWIQVPDAVDPLVLNWELRYLDLTGLVIQDPATDPRLQGAPGENRLVYPQNNRFADLLKAAVTLCIHNPDTKLAMVGSPGLGGWDDHNSAMTEYENRMQSLMSAVRAAIKHIKYSVDDPTVLAARNGEDTSNIIINIFTDFGRNTNLNNSKGWDHGNTQCLYTLGGRPYIRDPDWTPAAPSDVIQPVKNADLTSTPSAVASPRPSGALGKIVGTTNIFGTAGQNRLFTKPSETTDPVGSGTLNPTGLDIPSYEFEPQAIASTIYGWFGVTNPEVLTQNNDTDFATGTITRIGSDGNGNLVPETVNRSAGEPAIDENVAGVTLATTPLTVKTIQT